MFTEKLNISLKNVDNDQQNFPAHKMVGSKNDKEWITPKIKYLIAQTWKAHHSGRQVVRIISKKKGKKA